MIKNSMIVQSKEEFEDVKLMMAEDAQINEKMVYFSDSTPEDFPCLVKIIEIEDISFEANFDENEPEDIFDTVSDFSSGFNSGSEEEDDDVIFQEPFGIFYDFWFLSKKEVQKLLES
jgi:hypothetical protein